MNNLFTEHQKCIRPGNLGSKKNFADVDISLREISGLLEHCSCVLNTHTNLVFKVIRWQESNL